MSEPDLTVHPYSDEELLTNALAGDERAWVQLTNQLDRYLNRVISRRAGDLPSDIQEEVKQELWAAVARRGSLFGTASQEPAKRYIRRFLRPALDRVRSAYRPPATRSRLRNEAPDWEAPEVVSASAASKLEDKAIAAEFRRVDARLEIETLLRIAAPLVSVAAMLMALRGFTLTEAARAVGTGRVALHRGLRALGRRRTA